MAVPFCDRKMTVFPAFYPPSLNLYEFKNPLGPEPQLFDNSEILCSIVLSILKCCIITGDAEK